MQSLYLNYTFNDGGFKKTHTTLDKYVYLLSNGDIPEREKVFYKPKKRAVITRPLRPSTILHRYYAHLFKDRPYYVARNNNMQKHMEPIYTLNTNQEIVFGRRVQEFIDAYNEIKHLLTDKNKVYNSIKIPKKKKKNGRTQYRQLYEPIEELKEVQTKAKEIIEEVLRLHPHDAVHSYTKKRDNVTNAKMHKYSKHIIKVDLADYFSSIEPTFLYYELSKFKELCAIHLTFSEREYRKEQNEAIANPLKELTKTLLDAIIDVATYKNGLPQGSPLSPTLSNIVFFKVDHELQEYFNTQPPLSKTRIMYTRYSDDLTFSSFNPINKKELINTIKGFLEDTPFKINEEKTKYLKNTHRCYITGVKLNKDNNTTYGHEKKAQLKRDIFQLFMMYKEGSNDTQHASEVLGQLAYLQKIEPAYAKSIIQKYCKQFQVRPKLFYKYFLG